MISKTKVLGILGAGVLALAISQPAHAAAFVKISAGLDSVSCDNGTAAGVIACVAAGFDTSLNSNIIEWSKTGVPTMVVGGYTFGAPSSVSNNVPGSAALGRVSDLKGDVTKSLSAIGNLFVDFGGYNFTLPPGPDLILSASTSATYDTSTATDFSRVTGWGRKDNSNSTTPGGDASTATPNCTPGAGVTTACSSLSPDVAFTRLATPFSLFGHEEIQLAVGSMGRFTSTIAVIPSAVVPEPASMLLLGTGLFGIGTQLRKRWTKK